MSNPLEQFVIKPVIPFHVAGVDASLTNSGTFMVLATAAITVFVIAATSKRAIVPGRWQSMAELSYEFVAGMVRDNVGNEGRKYFPFIFSLFMFILFGNLLGLIPYAFAFTSHIVVTFSLALTVFVGVTLIGIFRHGFHFLSFFVPKGVPVFLLPLLVVIELVSYMSRPFSLAIRLFANMMAGHTMLKVFGGFVVALGVIGGWAPLAMMVALSGFEFLVAFLQAYVFAILACLYLNDAIHLH